MLIAEFSRAKRSATPIQVRPASRTFKIEEFHKTLPTNLVEKPSHQISGLVPASVALSYTQLPKRCPETTNLSTTTKNNDKKSEINGHETRNYALQTRGSVITMDKTEALLYF